jgi:hypothetical protein
MTCRVQAAAAALATTGPRRRSCSRQPRQPDTSAAEHSGGSLPSEFWLPAKMIRGSSRWKEMAGTGIAQAHPRHQSLVNDNCSRIEKAALADRVSSPPPPTVADEPRDCRRKHEERFKRPKSPRKAALQTLGLPLMRTLTTACPRTRGEKRKGAEA